MRPGSAPAGGVDNRDRARTALLRPRCHPGAQLRRPRGPRRGPPVPGERDPGRGVPPERLDAVEEHYQHFGGVSPINARNRELIAAIAARTELPVYFGNRNWRPFAEDTVREMAEAGVERALVFATSAYGGYSACRQYHEDIARARDAVGEAAPSWSSCALLLRPPGLRARQRRRRADGVGAAARGPARGGAAGVHGALHPHLGRRGRRGPRPTAGTATPGRSPRPPRWSPPSWASTSSTSSGSPAPVRRRCRGWSPTSSTTSTTCTPRVCPRSSSRRSGSCPTTSRSCGTSTTRPPSVPSSTAWASPARHRRARPAFADMVVELVREHTDDAPARRLGSGPSRVHPQRGALRGRLLCAAAAAPPGRADQRRRTRARWAGTSTLVPAGSP